MNARIWSFSGLVLAAVTFTAFAAPTPALAEGKVRIVEQFGFPYLPLHIIREKGLLQQEAAKLGIPDAEIEWAKVSGGAAANDALLSGSVDVAAAGVGPLLTIWDRTRGAQDVRGIGALTSVPFYLVSNNPKVQSIADLTEADKIAVPSVKVSVQARTLQLAAAKLFGPEKFDALDHLTVALPHPDATQALISNSGSITGHFSNAPFQYQALKAPGVHKILDSHEVLGGVATSVAIYTTAKFRNENPLTYKAFVAALDAASAFIAANKEEAADIYIKVEKSKLERAFLLELLNDPQTAFGVTPERTFTYAEFLHRVGALKTKAESWQDYFFEEIHDRAGS